MEPAPFRTVRCSAIKRLDKQELDDAARVMEMKKVRRLPVINGKKRMIGMLSLGDVYHKAPDHLSDEVMNAVSAHHT